MIKSYQTLRGLDPQYIEQLRGRFWGKVDRTGDCWEWQAAVNSQGYGCISIMSKSQLAHRVSHELNIGPIPAGMLICHKCDNPLCVRPDHFFLGNTSANIQDAIQKGRHKPTKGYTKLTAALVATMRQDYQSGMKTSALAEKYQVSGATVRNTVHGRQWLDAPGPIAPSCNRYNRRTV
jgi:hypothetical protein